MFLNFFGKATPLVFQNNFKIIPGSKLEKSMNTEARKIVRYLIKRSLDGLILSKIIKYSLILLLAVSLHTSVFFWL